MPRPPKPEPPKIAKRVRSRVTNGAALFIHGQATSAESRRFTDILRAVIADLGGADAPLSEAQKQIARRAASLSVSCEKLEEIILAGATSAAEQAFMSAAGGLSPYVVLRESSRVLHALARMKGGSGNSISELAKLPDEQLDRVTSLLKSAGDLAAKAINAGSAASADLQLLGELSDRCGRAFGRLGLARIPREVGALPLPYTSAPQAQVWSPLRDAIARDTQDAQPVDADALEPIDVSSEAAP